VIETPQRLWPVEVKAARRVTPKDTRGLQAFLQEYGAQAPFGIVLCAGHQWRRPARDIVALPWLTFVAN